jgi:SAM-dependent methyltransferase
LYWGDAKRNWSFVTSSVLILSLFFVCSTTIHPWYLLAVLPLSVFFQPPLWSWLWLGIASVCTYLFYIDGPYWSTVAIGWGGGGVLFLRMRGEDLLHAMMQWRAARKAERVRPALIPLIGDLSRAPRVLDLGAGEGYVGEQLKRTIGAEVHLADVVDLNRTALPHVVYDGRHLPFDDDAFHVTVLYFVLHHCEDPRAVLKEALRVSQRGVVVVESTYSKNWQRRVLRMLDIGANRLRSGGRMSLQEAHLAFRHPDEWCTLIREVGGTVRRAKRFGSTIHEQVLFVIG